MMQQKPVLTVIGSYPVNIDRISLMDSYFTNQQVPSWHPYIEQAVNDMLRSGVNLVSDGQTRDPFMTIFTRGLSGCRVREQTEVINPVEFTHAITRSDLKFVRSLLPDDVQLLGLIVGPFTLSQSVVDQYYHDEKELAFAFAEALYHEAKSIEPMVDMISVDEPFFANDFPDYASELLDIVLKDVTCPTRLHACGDVSDMVPWLLDLPVDILSHEFMATPSLFDGFAEFPNEQKQICMGCVRSDNDRVESVDEIREQIRKGKKVFGDRLAQIAPDCGLRLLPKDNAFQKLVHLKQAVEEEYDE